MRKISSPPIVFIAILLSFTFAIPFLDLETVIKLIVILSTVPLLSIFLHELGHLIIGIIVGLKPQEMIVGPFRLLFRNRVLTLGLNYSWLHVGGTIRFAPNSDDLQKMASKWSLMALGGPIASLISSIFILIVGRPLSIWGEGLFWINLAIGIATLVPLSNGASHSDGKLYMILRNKSIKASLLIANVMLQRDYLSQRAPIHWNSKVITNCVQLLHDSTGHNSQQLIEEAELRLFLYYHFADHGEPAQALTYIRPVALSQYNPKQTTAIIVMIKSLYACHLLLDQPGEELLNNEATNTATKLITNLSKRDSYSYHKAWAILLAVQNRKSEGVEHLSQAKLLLERWFRPFGVYHFEQRILAKIEEILTS